MADERVPDAWMGKDVVMFRPQMDPTYGQLESMHDSGLVIRHRAYVSWRIGESTLGAEQRDSDNRLVSEFFPWHVMSGFRLQEEEEKKVYANGE